MRTGFLKHKTGRNPILVGSRLWLGGGLKNGVFGPKIPPHFFAKSQTPLTKICHKMAKIHVNRRKILARSARGFPSHFYFGQRTPR